MKKMIYIAGLIALVSQNGIARTLVLNDVPIYKPKFDRSLAELATRQQDFHREFESSFQDWKQKYSGLSRHEIVDWESKLSSYQDALKAIQGVNSELSMSWWRIAPYEKKAMREKLDSEVLSLTEKTDELAGEFYRMKMAVQTHRNAVLARDKAIAQKDLMEAKARKEAEEGALVARIKTLKFASGSGEKEVEQTVKKMEYLKFLLTTHKRVNESYPSKLEELFKVELQSLFQDRQNAFLIDAWKRDFKYRKDGDSCLLISAGKDQAYETPDDIKMRLD